jgi:hypothetical protein
MDLKSAEEIGLVKEFKNKLEISKEDRENVRIAFEQGRKKLIDEVAKALKR